VHRHRAEHEAWLEYLWSISRTRPWTSWLFGVALGAVLGVGDWTGHTWLSFFPAVLSIAATGGVLVAIAIGRTIKAKRDAPSRTDAMS
jgi:hypothetical protein